VGTGIKGGVQIRAHLLSQATLLGPRRNGGGGRWLMQPRDT